MSTIEMPTITINPLRDPDGYIAALADVVELAIPILEMYNVRPVFATVRSAYERVPLHSLIFDDIRLNMVGLGMAGKSIPDFTVFAQLRCNYAHFDGSLLTRDITPSLTVHASLHGKVISLTRYVVNTRDSLDTADHPHNVLAERPDLEVGALKMVGLISLLVAEHCFNFKRPRPATQ